MTKISWQENEKIKIYTMKKMTVFSFDIKHWYLHEMQYHL